MRFSAWLRAAPIFALASSVASAAPLSFPHSFQNGTVASADEVDADFETLASAHNAVMTPVLLTPESASITSLSRLEWAGGGGLYEVEMDASPAFSNPFRASTGAHAVPVSELLRAGSAVTPGTWHWRVRATSGDASWTSVTRTVTFDADGSSCAQILASAGGWGSLRSGYYWLKPGSGAAYHAWCDMVTNGGGWTLVWTKTTPGFVMWKATFDSACAASLSSDCASAVNPAQSWSRALWRFADDASCWVQFDNRRHADFRAFLNGANLSALPTVSLSKSLDGVTTPESGVPQMHYYSGRGISESHAGSDTWIDLWYSVDGTNNYVVNEDPATLTGTKCLCGRCRQAPVWMLVK